MRYGKGQAVKKQMLNFRNVTRETVFECWGYLNNRYDSSSCVASVDCTYHYISIYYKELHEVLFTILIVFIIIIIIHIHIALFFEITQSAVLHIHITE